jgi:hypothetical protein
MMGKPYNHQYFFSGSRNSCGTMVCAHCQRTITPEAEDWLAYQKSSKEDWYYVCFHRKCRTDQSGWLAAEAASAERKSRDEAIQTAVDALCARFAISRDDLAVLLEVEA